MTRTGHNGVVGVHIVRRLEKSESTECACLFTMHQNVQNWTHF